MATPTSNSVTTTSFGLSTLGDARYLAHGTKWGGGLGTGVALTYSFPGSTAYFETGYSEFQTYTAFNATEQAAVRLALATWSSVAAINFVQLADNSTTVGELRFAKSTEPAFAYAYLPGNYVAAGDSWYDTAEWNTGSNAIVRGDYDFNTLIHEIGHALGLKHSFETPNAIPAARDSFFYTVMSYTAAPFSVKGDNYASFYPTTPMFNDIVAMQAIYGRNPNHNAGNTTYTFNDGSRYFQTIDDVGGYDTIVFNGNQSCKIDLRIGFANQVSEAIDFSTRTSRDTVYIGPKTDIERAIGGNGADMLIGNSKANALLGRAGGDTLLGGAGNDNLTGGPGRDTLSGGTEGDIFRFETGLDSGTTDATYDVILDFVVNVDELHFTAMDASTVLANNNDFVWRGTGGISTSAVGELRYQKFDFANTANDYTLVYGDTDADAAAEFIIRLKGLVTLSAADIIV
ncbi:MAG: matrixin family metalloprotease [Hyphomicrobium sp.]|nr:matrixin family metalloprotease [Hyphomicrobium sp.]